jgi:hypothetical protein
MRLKEQPYMSIPTSTRLVATLSIFALAAQPIAAVASSFTDLEGVRASAAENTIRQRGYHPHHNSPAPNGRYTYWWNNLSKSCIRTFTSDGVIAGTKTVTGADCGWYGGPTNVPASGSGGNKDAAAVAAVAAAALIGVAALSHKSHHRDDKEYQDPQSYGEFERGYRDGLYNHSFDSRNRSEIYSDGYRAGVEEREQQSTHRRGGYAQNSGSYGGGQQAQFSDLVGGRSAGVETQLQSRGFRSVDSFQSGSNGRGTVWWNGRSRQCLQVITVEGRADSITDIQTHPRCN